MAQDQIVSEAVAPSPNDPMASLEAVIKTLADPFFPKIPIERIETRLVEGVDRAMPWQGPGEDTSFGQFEQEEATVPADMFLEGPGVLTQEPAQTVVPEPGLTIGLEEPGKDPGSLGFVLSGVIYNTDRPMAIVDGKVVREKDIFVSQRYGGELTIEAIRKGEVLMKRGDQIFSLLLR